MVDVKMEKVSYDELFILFAKNRLWNFFSVRIGGVI